MPESRSFAPSLDPAGAPPFPMWPYAFTAYAEHCSRDVADYVERLAKADDALAVIAAEESLSLNLLADMSQAFQAMMWGSFGAAMAAAGAAPTQQP